MMVKQKVYRSLFGSKNACDSIRDSSSALCISTYIQVDIHVIKWTPGHPPPFLHTASDQQLEGGKAWEQGSPYLKSEQSLIASC